MYETQTEATIRQRMLDAANAILNKSEGGFLWDTISPAAIELALAYIELDRVLAMGFAETSAGVYLDYRASEHGITRLSATKATGSVTVTGTDGTVVPIGSLFATAAGTQFATTAQVTIASGSATVAVEAVTAGATGNVPPANITVIPVAIAGVSAVTNSSATTGGTDAETDEALLTRLLAKVREPATSGNAYHYRQWALSVAGIGDAKVQPLWSGAGTVRLILIDTNKAPASGALVTAVQTYVESVRPIGAAVTYVAATALNINVSATLTLQSGYTLAGVKPAIEAAITAYLKSIAFQQDYVSYAQIGNAIIDTEGVKDYASLQVNGGTANVTVGADKVSIKGVITLT